MSVRHAFTVSLIITLCGALMTTSLVSAHPHHHEGAGGCLAAEWASREGYGKNSPKVEVETTETLAAKRKQTSATTWDKIRVLLVFDQGDCTTPATSGNTRCGHCLSTGQMISTHASSTSTATRTCTADDVLTTNKKAYLMDVLMTAAKNYFERAMSVKRTVGTWTMGNSALCGTTPVMASHRSPGINGSDFVIYYTAYPFSSSTTLAAAATCRIDGSSSRPLAAHVNWNPKQLLNDAAGQRDAAVVANQISTTIHELLHGLGFSGSPWFPNGILQLDGTTVSTGTGTTTTTRNGKTVTIMTSPRVVREARSYFDCSTLEGAEIEDGGGSGTTGAHWEKRLFETEVMNGIDTTPLSFMSPMTFGFLEDTTWYRMDYSYCQNNSLTWGYKKGCNFVTAKCNSDSVRTMGEFCFDATDVNTESPPYNRACSHDKLATGICRVGTYSSSLSSAFQYFSDPARGGLIESRDFCPTVEYDTSCINSKEKDSQVIFGNTYGASSRCFNSNLINRSYVANGKTGARCFTTTCGASSISFTIDGTTVACPADGSKANVTLPTALTNVYRGFVECPAYSDLCVGDGKYRVVVTELLTMTGISADAVATPTTVAPPAGQTPADTGASTTTTAGSGGTVEGEVTSTTTTTTTKAPFSLFSTAVDTRAQTALIVASGLVFLLSVASV